MKTILSSSTVESVHERPRVFSVQGMFLMLLMSLFSATLTPCLLFNKAFIKISWNSLKNSVSGAINMELRLLRITQEWRHFPEPTLP